MRSDEQPQSDPVDVLPVEAAPDTAMLDDTALDDTVPEDTVPEDTVLDDVALDVAVATAPASSWRAWLPAPEQVRCAVRLNLDEAIDGDAETRDLLGDLPATSMRQGLGLVFVAALFAGFLPFVLDLLLALQSGTSVLFAQMAVQSAVISPAASEAFAPLRVWSDTVATIAGLEPIAPGWLAATLSALGNWLNWPLRWLSSWIVYGLCVLAVAKLLGAPTTLQRHYAGVSYAYLPLLLLGLTPIPYVGPVFALAGLIWAMVVYVQAVRVVAGFDTLRALVAVVSPALIGLLAALAVAAAIAVSVLRLFV